MTINHTSGSFRLYALSFPLAWRNSLPQPASSETSIQQPLLCLFIMGMSMPCIGGMDGRVQIDSERQRRQRRDAVRSCISGRGAGGTGGVSAEGA